MAAKFIEAQSRPTRLRGHIIADCEVINVDGESGNLLFDLDEGGAEQKKGTIVQRRTFLNHL